MMSTSMLAKEKCLRKVKASKVMAKVARPNGVRHVMIIGRQAVAHRDIIAPSAIQGNSQADVQSADRLVILHLNV